MARVGLWLTLLAISFSLSIHSAGAANPCVAKAIRKITNATYVEEVKARFKDQAVYNAVNTRVGTRSDLDLYYEKELRTAHSSLLS